MAKLKCVKHDRRVLTGKNSFLHRTGDMSRCDGNSATIGGRLVATVNSEYLKNRANSDTIDLTRV